MAEAGVEVAVLEVGLGGRLDADHLRAVVTVITRSRSITGEFLGDSLPAIAREKAGILKPEVPCFVGRLPPEADAEVERAAEAVGAPLFRLGRDFARPPFPVALAGAHQIDNAAIAAQLARAAARHLGKSIDDRTLARALAGVRWPGRCERVGGRPAVRRRAQRRWGARAGGGGRGARAGAARGVARLHRRRQGSGGDARGAGAGRGGGRGDPFGQSARAAARDAGGDGRALRSRRHRRGRCRRGARRGAPARGPGRPRRGLRLDVPGRDAAGARAGRGGRIQCRRRTRYWGAVKEFPTFGDGLCTAKPRCAKRWRRSLVPLRDAMETRPRGDSGTARGVAAELTRMAFGCCNGGFDRERDLPGAPSRSVDESAKGSAATVDGDQRRSILIWHRS